MSELAGIVAAAVVGTARRSVDWSRVPQPLRGGTGEEAVEVLATAGRAAVAERAGSGLVTAGEPAEPAGPETLSAPGEQFLRLFTEALGSRRFDLTADGLRMLAARGRRLPIGAVVPVLELATGRRELRPLMAPVLGERGSWLARQNPAWRFAELLAPRVEDERIWTEGALGERVAWLAAVRASQPARARDLLAAALPGEPAGARIRLLELLTDGLAPVDEPLLEAALDDRSRPVRELAQSLLPRLTESAYTDRMRERVRDRLRRGRLGGWRVDLADLTAADERDGLIAVKGERPPGRRAMATLIGSIPIADWPALGGRSAVRMAGAEVTGGPGFETGLGIAAARERDGELALALLQDQELLDEELFELTEVEAGDRLLDRRIGRDEPKQWLAALGVRHWSPRLTDLVLRWLESPQAGGGRPGVLALCGSHGSLQHRVDAAGRLRRMARGFPGPQQNQAFNAAMNLELRRGLAEALT
ncbi:hypothetical protein CGZ96_01495 [Enemella evansiae]|uniref:DUF5691 domain-containing protein n=1 Tax=Enemella evansiae TaxID=2016499 RepID=UPI000B96E823|nr:DUF5691 domain-containing protein [Enemella evansiae]OYO03322.1 hypothetical protein CGZ96_01495 [Enemella evansiae]